jgi:alpha-glucosidase (family GH31 glycosyl hydrolase)
MPTPYSQLDLKPKASPKSIVYAQNARFTLLTSRLIRIEYSPNNQFEDRASQAFWYREQSTPEFTVNHDDNTLIIDTHDLLLKYTETAQGFTPLTLSVHVRATGKTWLYGQNNQTGENLRGTARTLDRAGGEVQLGWGLIARSGWAVIDDTDSLVFDEKSWLTPRSAHPEARDLYFFGYGHAYREALYEFTKVAGKIPLIPRWALGNWWSRYWAYSADELLSLMKEFKANNVPLSVCIVDMDWHLTETGNSSTGWTGYTWNKELFPDPPDFLNELHKLGLKTGLNLHPAEGIHPHEEQYPAVAKRLGIDPESETPIPFDIASPKFTQAYFEELHHPYEKMGVDFWWIDWQQGTRSNVLGLDPLWWLNHLHFYDLARDGLKRGFVFSRWGELGNHRYPIGFSGDALIQWEALQNQPNFTATAANVAYSWWSHDIGGHMGGIEDDELYLRWVQFGVFSPIFRLHSTNTHFLERRPWARGRAVRELAMDAMRLRHRLISYIYSVAWHTHQTGEALVTPMYYSHPEDADAYECPNQYWFGSELVAAPFTKPANPETRLAQQNIWFPAGDWFDFFTGERVKGGGWQRIYGDLEKIPVWAKAGAIISLDREDGLDILIFPGANNAVTLYEDDGETDAYQQGAYALTKLSQTWNASLLEFELTAAQINDGFNPEPRTLTLQIRGIAHPSSVTAWLDDAEQAATWTYDKATETLTLNPIKLTPLNRLRLEVRATDLSNTRSRQSEKVLHFLGAFRLETWEQERILNDWAKIANGEYDLRRYKHLSVAQATALNSLIKS